MAKGVLMPKAGITVESCIIGEWKKQVGDDVKIGDILFTGDTLFAHGYGRTDLYGGSFPQLMQSLRRLLRMNIHIYPGHGEDAVFRREGNK